MHSEEEIGKFRDLLPAGTSVAQALAAANMYGDTKEEKIAAFTKLLEADEAC